VKKLVIAALLAALGLILPPAATVAAGPVEIEVILSLTGLGAYLGQIEAQTLGALEQIVNKQGGISGQPVKFNISDDQSNPTVSVQIANGLIAKRVTYFLGSSLSAVCRSVAPLVEKAGPLNYCFSPGMRPVSDGYVFAAGASAADVGVVEARFFRERKLTQIAMLSTTDSSGQQDHEWFAETLRMPENRTIQLVADERFNPSDISVAAQMSRIKAARPQALLVKATGSAFATALRAYNDLGMDVPMSASGSNLIATQLAQYTSFAPKELHFAATRGIVPDPSLPRGPLRDAQNMYFTALAAAGIPPSNNAVLAWDPAWILIGALRRLGPNASAEQLHTYIEGLHDFAGVSGTFDFRTGNQRGLGPDALLMYRWVVDGNRFVLASKAGGRLK
jgi:branched-chain amino acid transport system substrate-binding protein